MRHSYFFLVLLLTLFLSIDVSGQCVPDTTITGLYSPTELEGLPEATIGQAYEAVIHMSVPAETTITINLNVDSVVLTAVNGLPSGLQYECQNATCGTEGGDYGCIRIFGTPDNPSEVGKNDIVAVFQLHTNLPTFTYDLKDYSIQLKAGSPAAVGSLQGEGIQFYAENNPLTKGSSLIAKTSNSGKCILSIYSLLGSEVGMKSFDANGGITRVLMDDFNLQPGVYFAILRQGSVSNTIRFVLQ